jgi:hypothetical protein
MEPISIGTTLAVLFFTKALEKTGEKFGEGLVAKMGQTIARIRHHAPKVADAIEAGDKEILKDPALAQIPMEPILGEFVAAADAEPNVALQAKLPDIKAGKIVQAILSGIEVEGNLNAKSWTQTAPPGSTSVDQTILKDAKVKGDINLDYLSQG